MFEQTFVNSDEATKVQYNSSQYELHEFDGEQSLHLLTTDMVYTEGDFQVRMFAQVK